MYQLSEQQIDYIFNDISARGVEMESLQQNLLDHICCIIENNLEANGDFESFYQKTITTFYKDELWEIEEETLQLLTYKNYYTMKKVMIYSGTFSAAAMIFGIIFKFMHWPGASACLILGISISSLIFLPLLFTLKVKEKQSSKDKLILGLGVLSGILMSLFVLFRIMRWPGTLELGLTSVAILGFIFLPIYFFSGIRNPDKKMNTLTVSILIVMLCGLWLTLISFKPQARKLDNTEIEYLSNDELMIKSEAENLYQVAGKDTSLTQTIKWVKDINKLCDELKSELLEYEIGYKVITKDLKNKDIVFTVALVSNFFEKNKEEFTKIAKLNNLVFKQSFACYREKLRITKKDSYNKFIQFQSTILNYESDNFYYNNTILGAYKDLCAIQLNAIEEVKELIELKQIKG